ncbi:glutathione S-transferase, partial [Acinetobacter baumannii]
VIELDGEVIAETGAIVQLLCERFGNGAWLPAPGTPEARQHLQLMHFAEGSAMTPILLNLYTSRLGEAAAPLQPRIQEQLASQFAYLA